MKLSVIVPCFNEVDNIHKIETELVPVLDELIGYQIGDGSRVEIVEVIFVDDGSVDKTKEVLRSTFRNLNGRSFSVLIESHETNRGLGAALRTGFLAATGEVILTTDSDGTYHFSTIPAMLTHMKEGVDIVTASPYHPLGEVVGVPPYRIVLSRGSSMIYRILVNWRVHTYTSLFRAYRKDVVKRISFTADDYLGATELMVKSMLNGFKVEEYPAALHRRIFGVSKARLVRTILSHLRFQFRLLLHQLRLSSIFK